MISWHDLYTVLTAVVPLYVAMILGYGSVRWWGIFTPDQCSGINRFVAIFLVPLLSFHFIYANDPYAMNFRFLAADTLQKLIILVGLTVWSRLPSCGGGTALAPRLDWSITLFSVSTLPNTLVIGIPLLSALYGPYSGSLMVQIVVLQSLVWYTLLLFLFEFRAARMLIAHQFPAAAIASMRVDPDVVSLDGGHAEAEAEAAEDGRLHVTVRRSSASRRSQMSSGAEMHSTSSSRQHSLRGFNNFNLADSSFGASEVYSMHSARSNFDVFTGGAKEIQKVVPVVHLPLNCSAGKGKEVNRALSAAECEDLRFISSKTVADAEAGEAGPEGPTKLGSSSTAELQSKCVDGADAVPARPHQTPAASVMTRVALVMVWRKLTRNPNTYASVIGLTWSLISFRWHIFMPAIVAKSISILSDAGLGMAMYSLGLSTALQPRIIACGYRAAGYSMAVRFLAAPVITAAASLAIGLRGTLLRITILQAALPQGIVPFVFAKEYSLHPALLSTSVIFGLAIAVPIILVYYIILGLIK